MKSNSKTNDNIIDENEYESKDLNDDGKNNEEAFTGVEGNENENNEEEFTGGEHNQNENQGQHGTMPLT